MVDPMVTYLLPLLIGYTGGKIIHDQRGGVVGAIATMGVIVGCRYSDVPWCHDYGAAWRICD